MANIKAVIPDLKVLPISFLYKSVWIPAQTTAFLYFFRSASMATVRVESTLGIGTGFFISERGHILTNRHVLQQDKTETEKQRQHYREIEQKLRTYGEQIRQGSTTPL